METVVNLIILGVVLFIYFSIKSNYNYRVHVKPAEKEYEHHRLLFENTDKKLLELLKKVNLKNRTSRFAYDEFKQPRLDFHLKHLNEASQYGPVNGLNKNELNGLVKKIKQQYEAVEQAYTTYRASLSNLERLNKKYK